MHSQKVKRDLTGYSTLYQRTTRNGIHWHILNHILCFPSWKRPVFCLWM